MSECFLLACAAGCFDASLVFIVFVYVYVVIVNKHRAWLWITLNFVYGSMGCVNHKLAKLTRIGTRSQGQLFDGLVNQRCYQGFAHKLPGGLYKSYPDEGVDNIEGVRGCWRGCDLGPNRLEMGRDLVECRVQVGVRACSDFVVIECFWIALSVTEIKNSEGAGIAWSLALEGDCPPGAILHMALAEALKNAFICISLGWT